MRRNIMLFGIFMFIGLSASADDGLYTTGKAICARVRSGGGSTTAFELWQHRSPNVTARSTDSMPGEYSMSNVDYSYIINNYCDLAKSIQIFRDHNNLVNLCCIKN